MKISILLMVLIATVLLAYLFHEKMEVRDRSAYEDDYETFVRLNDEVTGLSSLDGDFYAVAEYRYEKSREYRFPSYKKEYLEDKRAYYEEVRYQDPVYYKKLIDHVNAELKGTNAYDPVRADRLFTQNMERYCKRSERLLPLYNKMEAFFAFKFVKDREQAVTHGYHDDLKEAIKDLETIKGLQSSLPESPTLFFVLDGGDGKKVPLDGYEKRVDRYEK